MTAYQANTRDRIVYRICSFVTRFATPEYRALLRLSATKVLEQATTEATE